MTTARPSKRASRMPRLFAASAAALIILAAIQASGATAASGTTTAQVVRVKMRDFSFTLSLKSLKRGVVTFALNNAGQATHNFKIGGRTSKVLNPGERASLTVSFTKPGKYPYLCTIPGHAELGMKGTLAVT